MQMALSHIAPRRLIVYAIGLVSLFFSGCSGNGGLVGGPAGFSTQRRVMLDAMLSSSSKGPGGALAGAVPVDVSAELAWEGRYDPLHPEQNDPNSSAIFVK